MKNHPDAKAIINYLNLRFETTIGPDTLLFFDEIQEAVQILTAAKYFKQDFADVPVIMTDSLVRIKLKQLETETKSGNIRFDPEIEAKNQDGHNNFLFPVGMLDEMDMFPMTFDEFANSFKPSLYKAIEKSFESKTPLDSVYHQMALDCFYEYLQVGGMPEAVAVYLESKSILEAQKTLQTVFSDYLSDISLYQISSQTIARTKMVFNSIYMELSKENKNFKVAEVEKGKRFRDYLSAFAWLSLARLIYKSDLVKEHVCLPLKPDSDSLFRVYLPDCGLFAYESRINLASFADSLNRNDLSGIFMENYVAEELSSRNVPLFYWKGKTSSEFEFVIDIGNSVVPVDAKKNRGKLDSLNAFKKLNHYDFSIKVSQNKYGYDKREKILTIPFYAWPFFLNEEIASGRIRPLKR